ncbi:hypothetical protein [Thermococcus waiotapuensis]|uniref:Uncharacterized protein n=1 Tax=Thermococcus waiotapuensis TaxID=90909 RepID=A0AAE4NT10_9EURY|nr:hypothetical protein [Thermococcus waiotapuensis]MDV3103798.1 hypothetical protein [Thermococcus waiotapuensis]
MKKVLVKGNPSGVMVAGALFTVVFIIMSLSILSVASSFVPSWFVLPFIIVPLLILGVILGTGARILGGGKKASSLFNEASLTETSVAFPEEVEYELGRVFLEGYWSYEHTTTSSRGSSRSYRTRRRFSVEEKGRGLEARLPEGPFRVELRQDGTGTIEAPALRIRGGRYDGSLIVVLTDEGVVEGEGKLGLSKGEEVAQVSFRGDGKFLRGSVWAELSKARKVRVEVGSSGIWRKVAEGSTFDFTFSTLPEEKTVMFSHYDSITPRSILEKLWSGPVVMGHGTFELRAVLDIPMGRDVVETDIFKVKFGMETGKKMGTKEERG